MRSHFVSFLSKAIFLALTASMLTPKALAQTATPVDTLASESEECQRLIALARTCVGMSTEQIAKVLVDSSYMVTNITTSLGMEMGALLVGNKRFDIGLNYVSNSLCTLEELGDAYGPLHPIGCYWTATPTRLRVYCHGNGYTMTPIWDTVFVAQNSMSSTTWNPRTDSHVELMPDSLYLRHGRNMRELMSLLDSVRAWVPGVHVKTDSTIVIYIRPQLRLTVTLAEERLGSQDLRTHGNYEMLSDRRIRSIKFYRWPPKNAIEYKEAIREVTYPEPITTGDFESD